jgi:hypothetical protein
MGIFKNIDTVFKNHFREEEYDYDKLFHEFYEWLNYDEKNMMFVPSTKIGYYLNLCDNEETSIDNVCEYWVLHVKKGIHNGEGFVINN